MTITSVLLSMVVGGAVAGEAAIVVSAPDACAAPKPPTLEAAFSCAILLVEETGTERKANSRTITPNFDFLLNFLIFIVSLPRTPVFALLIPCRKDLYYYKNLGFLSRDVEGVSNTRNAGILE